MNTSLGKSKTQPFIADIGIPEHKLRQWASEQRSPIHYQGHVVFLYQGDQSTQQVELAGELSSWHRKGFVLERLPGDLFYLTLKLPAAARLEYKFLINGHWATDPWNPQQADSGIGSMNSCLTMPAYKEDPLTEYNPEAPEGEVLIHHFQGKAILGERQIYTYLPPNFDKSGQTQYPVIYFHDGSDYIHRGKLAWLLNNLIAQNKIRPLIAVCINPINRFQEYTFNHKYCELLIHEVVPWIDGKYPTLKTPQGRALCGSSLGGLTSTFGAYYYPHIFGKVLGQSSSFQFLAERMNHIIQSNPKHEIQLYLTAGRLEGLLKSNRRMIDILKSKGYIFEYHEYTEGHNWGHWKHRLSQGIEYLFGKDHESRI